MRRLLVATLLVGAVGCSDGDNGSTGLGSCGSSWRNDTGSTPDRCALACQNDPRYTGSGCLAQYTRTNGTEGGLQCNASFVFDGVSGCCIPDVLVSGGSAYDVYFGECEGSN